MAQSPRPRFCENLSRQMRHSDPIHRRIKRRSNDYDTRRPALEAISVPAAKSHDTPHPAVVTHSLPLAATSHTTPLDYASRTAGMGQSKPRGTGRSASESSPLLASHDRPRDYTNNPVTGEESPAPGQHAEPAAPGKAVNLHLLLPTVGVGVGFSNQPCQAVFLPATDVHGRPRSTLHCQFVRQDRQRPEGTQQYELDSYCVDTTLSTHLARLTLLTAAQLLPNIDHIPTPVWQAERHLRAQAMSFVCLQRLRPRLPRLRAGEGHCAALHCPGSCWRRRRWRQCRGCHLAQ